MPMYLDCMEDEAEKKYAGWPERLYVIGTNGKVAYAGDMGPMGFNPDSWEEALNKQI